MPAPAIELDDICRVYPGPPPVSALAGVNLSIDAGDYVTVIGPSGSGKSTLLNVLGLLDRPTQGTYRLAGHLIADLRERERTAMRARRIGFVFQEFHLLGYRTASENVALGRLYSGVGKSERRDSARAALRRVGLNHRLDALPTTMSGGERQRVAIARALVNNPALLLCDEPTGNLDSETASQVLDLLDALHGQGVTILVITHDSDTAARAQRSVTIRDGRLSASESPRSTPNG